MYDRHTFAAEDQAALHVADDLDEDGELEVAIDDYNTYLTLGQVRKLYEHLERVIEANKPARAVTAAPADFEDFE